MACVQALTAMRRVFPNKPTDAAPQERSESWKRFILGSGENGFASSRTPTETSSTSSSRFLQLNRRQNYHKRFRITNKLNTMAYSFDVVLPSSGRWDLVLVNFSNARDADGFMVAYVGAGRYTSTQQLLSTITSTSTITSATTPATSIPGFPVESIIVGMVTGLMALMILRRPKRKGQSLN